MPIQKIGRMLVRRGLRNDLLTDLLDGQLCFAVDTGELFIGAPTSTPSITDPRTDNNVRWLTEIDPVAQPNTFTSLNLDPGLNVVLQFPDGDDFFIFDYGLAFRTSGPYLAGSLKIFDVTINYVTQSHSSVTFSVQKVNNTRTLRATNNGANGINLTYQVRSWTDS